MTIKDLKAFITDFPDNMLVLLPDPETDMRDLWAYPVFTKLLVGKVMQLNEATYVLRDNGTIPALILYEDF